jgi:hypothetical protein
MSFSLPRFLRRTPPESLERYFAGRQIALPGPVDWTAPHADLLGTLQQAIEALGETTRERVILDLERAERLCDEVGQLALWHVVATQPALQGRLQSEASDEGRALVVVLEDEPAFDRALVFSYGDHRRNGRSWSRYGVADALTANNNPAPLQALKTDIIRLLRDLNGTGRKLVVDHFERHGEPADRRLSGPFIHYAIYAEGLPESGLEFEKDEPKRRTRKPAREASIYYSADQRLLEVVAEGGRLTRLAIAQSYSRNVLGSGNELTPISVRSFALDRLKRPMEFPTDSGDGIKSVRITLLRLRNMVDGRGRVTIEIEDSERTDIHAISERWFGDSDPLQRSEWRVKVANLKITFAGEKAGARDKTITVELRDPMDRTFGSIYGTTKSCPRNTSHDGGCLSESLKAVAPWTGHLTIRSTPYVSLRRRAATGIRRLTLKPGMEAQFGPWPTWARLRLVLRFAL